MKENTPSSHYNKQKSTIYIYLLNDVCGL